MTRSDEMPDTSRQLSATLELRPNPYDPNDLMNYIREPNEMPRHIRDPLPSEVAYR